MFKGNSSARHYKGYQVHTLKALATKKHNSRSNTINENVFFFMHIDRCFAMEIKIFGLVAYLIEKNTCFVCIVRIERCFSLYSLISTQPMKTHRNVFQNVPSIQLALDCCVTRFVLRVFDTFRSHLQNVSRNRQSHVLTYTRKPLLAIQEIQNAHAVSNIKAYK